MRGMCGTDTKADGLKNPRLPPVREGYPLEPKQKQIEKERAAGAVILSDPCGGGYYLADDPAELLRFARTLEARARNTIKAAESAHRALDAATGQESMEGWVRYE